MMDFFSTTFNGYKIDGVSIFIAVLQAAFAVACIFLGRWGEAFVCGIFTLSTLQIAYYRAKSEWLEARTPERPEVSE